MAKQPSQTRRLMRTIFNPKVWMDLEQVKASTNYLTNGATKLFTMKEKVVPFEDFEGSMTRLGVDEEKLLSQKKSLFRLSILMIVLSIFVFSYSLMHIYYANYHSAAASVVIFLVLLSLAFRYHFWYYQLKVRRLGCGIKEWFINGLLGVKK